MFKRLLTKPRKGNLIAILLFAVMMAIMSLGTLSVAMTLYASGQSTAEQYANVQTYRAAIEMACYQYVNDLESVVVTKDLTTDWISVSGSAIYTQALDTIGEVMGRPDAPLVWNTSTIDAVLAGVTVSDPTVMMNMLTLLTDGRTEFSFTTSGLEIDWSAGESYISSNESVLKLLPLEVTAELSVKSEILKEVLFIDGLYLCVTTSISGFSAGQSSAVTFYITEGERGLQIYRA